MLECRSLVKFVDESFSVGDAALLRNARANRDGAALHLGVGRRVDDCVAQLLGVELGGVQRATNAKINDARAPKEL